MSRRTAVSIAVAAAVLGASAPAAHAYFATDPAFGEQAGSVATLTVRDSLLEPTALAIRNALAEPLNSKDRNLKRDASALSDFYAARGYEPNWIAAGKLGDPAKAVLAALAAADKEGLDPADYAVPVAALDGKSSPAFDDVAAAEISLGRAILLYARQAYAGRVAPRSISSSITIDPVTPEPADVLATVSAAPDPGAALQSYNPTHDGYVRLREQLAKFRATAAAAADVKRVVVPAGSSLRLGDTDPRVALLRERLEIAAEAEDPNVFDETVDVAVKSFQEAAGLTGDGIVGPRTLLELNGTELDNVTEIVANMERWRWLPRQLGRFYVHVNIPSFMVDVYKDGGHIFQTRIVVGKVGNETPIFSDEIEHVIVNPYWNVPESITVGEMLPDILRNPGSLSSGNYEVLASDGVRWNIVSPYQVNWFNLDTRRVRIRQRPGFDNALGVIKFMFPNQHDVYLHDTPAKSLFKRDMRAFSHGCMRLMEPLEFADVIFSEETDWNAARVKKLIGGPEQQVNLAHHIPVHITYFTALVDENGQYRTQPDVYGHNAKVKAALGL